CFFPVHQGKGFLSLWHHIAVVYRHIAVIASFVNAHFLAYQIRVGGWSLLKVLFLAKKMHGDSRLMAVCHRGDHILRPKSRISSEENTRMGGLEGCSVHNGHVPLIKFYSAVPFYPWESVFLTNGNQHIIRFNKNVGFTRRKKLTLAVPVVHGMYFFKLHPDQPSVFHFKAQRNMVVKNLDVLMHGVFLFPGRSFHRGKGASYDHFYFLPSQSSGSPATIHCGISATKHDHFFADGVGVLESYAGQPFYADMYVGGTFFSS